MKVVYERLSAQIMHIKAYLKGVNISNENITNNRESVLMHIEKRNCHHNLKKITQEQ